MEKNLNVKAYLVEVMENITTGKLSQRGDFGKLVSKVIPNKTLLKGNKINIRCAYLNKNNNLLVYLHRNGWFETSIEEFPKYFKAKKIININDFLIASYNDLNDEEKEIAEQILNNKKSTNKKVKKLSKKSLFNFPLLIEAPFNDLTPENKLNKILNGNNSIELTKTEHMLISYLKGEDLNKVEEEFQIDKSLKYKIKKHANEYKEKFLKKLA